MQGIISSVGNIDTGGQGGATDTFVKLTVDLTNVTPTTETINNKQYNKFTFVKNNLTFKTISPFGDEDTIAIDDALIYNMYPLSNNNDDKGLNISYDGNTFVGYVLAQESTLTTVTFMFTYYIILSQTSVLWKNYVDLVFNQTIEGGGGGLKIFTQNSTFIVPENVTKLSCTFIGAGGGGGGGFLVSSSNTYRAGGSGGGSGYQVIDHECTVTPSESIDVVVGVGGAGANSSSVVYPSPAPGGDGGLSGLYRNGSLVDANSYASGGKGGGSGTNYPGAVGTGYRNGTAATSITAEKSAGGIGGSGARTISYPCITMNVGAGGDGGIGQHPVEPTDINNGRPGNDGLVIICWGGVTASDIGLS